METPRSSKRLLCSSRWLSSLGLASLGLSLGLSLNACIEAEEFLDKAQLAIEEQAAAQIDKDAAPADKEASPKPEVHANKLQSFELQTGDSSIRAFLQKATKGHELEFSTFDAQLEMQGRHPTKLEVVVHTPSLHADHPALEQDIKSARVLRALRFPRAKFTSTQIKPASGQATKSGRHYTVEGQLRIRGASQLIRFDAELRRKGQAVVGHAQVPVDLAEFGLHDSRANNELVARELTLDMQLHFVPVADKGADAKKQ